MSLFKPFTVFVEGNIGSGKTTFLNYLKKYDNVLLLPEPIEKWRNCGGVNLLNLFYKEPQFFASSFQSYVTLTLLQQHLLQTQKSVKILERSLFSSRFIFLKQMYDNKNLHTSQYHVLEAWYDLIDKTFDVKGDLIIYLRTSPQVAFERVKKRARAEEDVVSLKFLEELHEYHDNLLLHNKFPKPASIITLDANQELTTMKKQYAVVERFLDLK